jgi:hypothetical protein
MINTAISDMEAAYTDASTRPNPDYVEHGAGTLQGATSVLTPESTSGVLLSLSR